MSLFRGEVRAQRPIVQYLCDSIVGRVDIHVVNEVMEVVQEIGRKAERVEHAVEETRVPKISEGCSGRGVRRRRRAHRVLAVRLANFLVSVHRSHMQRYSYNNNHILITAIIMAIFLILCWGRVIERWLVFE